MLKFLALQGASYIYDISGLRVNTRQNHNLFPASGQPNLVPETGLLFQSEDI
jgi:hypothetical protein